MFGWGAGASLIMVIAGMGAMSLAVGRVLASLVAGVLFLIYSPLPYRFGFSVKGARQLLAFGLPPWPAPAWWSLPLATLINSSRGKMLGAVALGLYVMAFNMAGWPASLLSQPLRSVAPATFARLQESPEEMRQAMLRITGLVACVMLPIASVLAVCAVPVVVVLYGEPGHRRLWPSHGWRQLLCSAYFMSCSTTIWLC